MERDSTRSDLNQVWSSENFSKAFGFVENKKNYIKKIGGEIYQFRQIKTPDELKQAQEVLRNGFGWKDIEIPPVHILALWEDTGGGNFAGFNSRGEMIGFAGGMGGGIDATSGKLCIISSMLAMNGKDYRSSGVGKQLKIIQAYYAKQNGYEVMKWLYDPERGENASLNMRKLGAKAEEFWIDKYGQMESNIFGKSIPTDRFRAVWRFTEDKVINRILGTNTSLNISDISNIPVATFNNLPNSKRVLVQISSDIDSITEDSVKIEKRLNLRTVLTHYFNKNYIASEFVTGIIDNERKNYYLLEPSDRG